jgi:hypothetical protein
MMDRFVINLTDRTVTHRTLRAEIPCPLHGDLDVKNKIMQQAPLSFGLSAGCHEWEAWYPGSLYETLGKLCPSFRPSRTARVFR